MPKQVKIVTVSLEKDKSKAASEREIADLLNAGWEIASSGGGTGKLHRDVAGFVIMVRG